MLHLSSETHKWFFYCVVLFPLVFNIVYSLRRMCYKDSNYKNTFRQRTIFGTNCFISIYKQKKKLEKIYKLCDSFIWNKQKIFKSLFGSTLPYLNPSSSSTYCIISDWLEIWCIPKRPVQVHISILFSLHCKSTTKSDYNHQFNFGNLLLAILADWNHIDWPFAITMFDL